MQNIKVKKRKKNKQKHPHGKYQHKTVLEFTYKLTHKNLTFFAESYFFLPLLFFLLSHTLKSGWLVCQLHEQAKS